MIFKILLLAIILLTPKNSIAKCSDEYSLLVLNPKTHEVYYEKRADKLRYPASLTKLMTLYLTFEAIENNKLSMDTELTVSKRAAAQWKFNADLTAGEKITVKDAVLGIMVKSFNDMAVVLADAVGQNEWHFTRMMTEKAQELKMYDTNFRNAAGFTDLQQQTTAKDMAKLALAIREDFPQYYKLFSTKEFTFKGKKFESHNHVLMDYKWAKGMKTGFTRASGYNLVSAAQKDGEEVMSIIMHCSTIEGRDDYTIQLFDKVFTKIEEDKKTEATNKQKCNNINCDKKIYTLYSNKKSS